MQREESREKSRCPGRWAQTRAVAQREVIERLWSSPGLSVPEQGCVNLQGAVFCGEAGVHHPAGAGAVMWGLSLPLGFWCSLSVHLCALTQTKHLTKGLRPAPTEHLPWGAAEHQPSCSPAAQELGHIQRLGRLQAGQAEGHSGTGLPSRHFCPCLVLGPRALAACPVAAAPACAACTWPSCRQVRGAKAATAR